MKKKSHSMLLLSVFLVVLGCNRRINNDSVTASETSQVNQVNQVKKKEDLKKIFNEDFNNPSLPSSWITEYPWGRTNPPELQYYSEDAFDFNGTDLKIRAERHQNVATLPFTSGLISSYQSFQFTYGYVEARLKIPSGKGLWPALWLLTSDTNDWDEIDIMEIVGSEPSTVNMTLHYAGQNGRPVSDGKAYMGVDYSKDFHVFAVFWTPKLIVWYVDGIERFRRTEHIPQSSMYLIANLAVGGEWPGDPDNNTVFPAFYSIDYIRVYQ